MAVQRYSVRKITALPLAKFGCILGALTMVLPGLVCAIGSPQVIAGLRTFLENAQESELDLLGVGVPVEFDFITLLGLETAQALIVRLDDQPFILGLLIFLVSVIGGGLLIALITLFLGWAYNILAMLTGGLDVELRDRN